MTRLDPDLERLGEALRASTTIDLVRERQAGYPSDALRGRHNDGARTAPSRRLRPRVFAGGTLGLAGVGAALVLALSAGGAAAPPAFAITTNGDGSVTVQINENSALPQANAKLRAMGVHEQVTIYMETGPAAASGPVRCTPAPGAILSGPSLKVLVGTNGTEVIGSGQSAGNTGAGTYHLNRCVATGDDGAGSTGNAGNTGAS